MKESDELLWAQVYASAYRHLTMRALACYKPEPHNRPDPHYGIHVPDAQHYAAEEADRAVEALQKRRAEGGDGE